MPIALILNERTGLVTLELTDNPHARLSDLQSAGQDRLSIAHAMRGGRHKLWELERLWANLRQPGGYVYNPAMKRDDGKPIPLPYIPTNRRNKKPIKSMT